MLGIVTPHQRAHGAVPQVPVRVHETRQHDHVPRVDFKRAGRLKTGADRDDRAIAHMHVGAGQFPQRGVHGEHMATTDDEFLIEAETV